ncbi:MAG: hypothetical protein WDM90_00340 [Ferruginibacter sp.]
MSNAILQFSIINSIILWSILTFKKHLLASTKYLLLLHVFFIAVIAEQLYLDTVSTNTWFTYPEFPVRFLFSPLLFLYVATYLNPLYKPGKKLLVLFILPALLDVIWCISISIYAYYNHFTNEQRFAMAHAPLFYIVRSSLEIVYSLYLTIRVLLLIRNFFKKNKACLC